MSGTRFLNVDLDVTSRDDLSPLVTALGDKAFVLHERRERGVHHVSFELTTQRAKTAEACLATFARLLEALPARARRVWDRARSRTFDIGIEAGSGAQSPQFRTEVSAATLERIAALGGAIAVTVYPRPEPARR